MSLDVIGLGENSVDFVYRVAAMPPAGGKQRISSHRVSLGGQVATAMCACAALGLRTAYVGAFGDDGHGRFIRQALRSRGIDLSPSPVRQAANRYAVVLVDERTGERTVLWERDPQLLLRPEEIPRAALASARVVHVDDVDVGASLAAARAGRDAGRTVTCDVDQLTPQTGELVDAVTVPILAEHVPAALTAISDVESALRALRRPHHRMLCATLGSRGSVLLAGETMYRAPAPQVEVVDTTGAGDVFRGAFIYALLRGDAPGDLLRFANAAAAVSCTREGAIDSVPSLADVERLL